MVLPAIILAAGASLRMGTPKPLLADPQGRSFVERILMTLTNAGVRDQIVVTGAHHALIAAVLEDAELAAPPKIVRNPDPSRGQLSSLRIGLELVPNAPAVLVTLVDVPLIRVETVTALLHAWRDRRAAILRPVDGERHGHPVVFDRRVFDALRSAPLDEGAKRVMRDFENEIENLPIHDEGSFLDVDTPEDYRRVIQGVQ